MNIPYFLPPSRFDAMSYAKPEFTRQQLNWAGKVIRRIGEENLSQEELSETLRIIENFRAAHSFPLNSFYMTLKRRSQKISSSPLVLVSQRIKRLISIANKLWDKEDMKLTQMQDIGGCRAVLPSIAHLYALRAAYRAKPLTHLFNGEKDYIANPKPTGYRSIHLKYRFSGNGPSKPWDQLKIEIQLRTLLQHRWATAVESAGTFTKEALKSNQGRQEWLRFFSLMASVFAIREECAPVPGTPTTLDELHAEIKQLNTDHHIVRVFSQYNTIIPHIQKQKYAKYFLVTLDPIKLEVSVRGFKKAESREANKAYTLAESMMPKKTTTQVVLVSVASMRTLKHAYPNYFLDTQDFLRDVRSIIGTEV